MRALNKQVDNKHRYATGFAITGSLMSIVFFIIVNYTTGSRYPWFIFPSFAVLWWPLSMLVARRHPLKVFSLIGCVIVIAFLGIINCLTSPGYLWFIYPAFAVLWWPLSVYFANSRTARLYSSISAVILIVFLAVVNYVFSPMYPWFFYAAFPILLWPVCVLLGPRAGRLPAAVLLSAATILYYAALNLLLSPGFPWIVFPAFAVLWWPLSVLFAKRSHMMTFSLCGALLSSALFIVINVLTTPHQIWAVYPVFAIMWCPLAIYYFIFKRGLRHPPQ